MASRTWRPTAADAGLEGNLSIVHPTDASRSDAPQVQPGASVRGDAPHPAWPGGWPALPDPALAPRHRVVVFAGGFGSGKTEIAVNFCLGVAAGGSRVTLIDLDIVKPFFRSREVADLLESLGVGLIVPQGEQFHSDLPVVLPEVRGVLVEPCGTVVVDVGGDAMGAKVLASLAGAFRPDGYELLLVINTRRPFTTDLGGLERVVADIRGASALAPTGLVANTHLLEETDVETVCTGYDAALELGGRIGLPVRMVCCLEPLVAALPRTRIASPVLPVRRLLWMPGTRRWRTSSRDWAQRAGGGRDAH